MYNYFMLIGYIDKIQYLKSNTPYSVARVYLKVRKSFKNADGEYSYDYIKVVAYDNLVQQLKDMNLKPNDKIGFKGRIDSDSMAGHLTLKADIILDFTNEPNYDTI